MRLWDKGYAVNDRIDEFTVGKDRETDLYLARFDILGTMAHITMLQSVGLLTAEELKTLLVSLKSLYDSACNGDFVIEDGMEDIHSQVEFELTRTLGDLGKKVHTGRSRNDQVLVDIKLFSREGIRSIVEKVKVLFETLQSCSERYKKLQYAHLVKK